MSSKPRFVFVMGPTAAGKSALSLNWAELTLSDIINCDSVQCYEKLQIGAAKPSPADLLRRPHHLYSYVPLEHRQGAGEYRRAFYSLIKEQQDSDSYFVVGGTGFYFQAIEHGMFPTQASFDEIRKELEEELSQNGADSLYEELKVKDPKAAERISINDHYRLVRALEIVRGEGRPLTEIQAQFEAQKMPFAYPLLKLGVGLDREALRQKVSHRVKVMISSGLIDEVQTLVKEGYEDSSALQSIGYKECLSYLHENRSLDWLQEEIGRNTMRLAKRQMTWFRRDPSIQWIDSADRLSIEKGLLSVRHFFDSL